MFDIEVAVRPLGYLEQRHDVLLHERPAPRALPAQLLQRRAREHAGLHPLITGLQPVITGLHPVIRGLQPRTAHALACGSG